MKAWKWFIIAGVAIAVVAVIVFMMLDSGCYDVALDNGNTYRVETYRFLGSCINMRLSDGTSVGYCGGALISECE